MKNKFTLLLFLFALCGSLAAQGNPRAKAKKKHSSSRAAKQRAHEQLVRRPVPHPIILGQEVTLSRSKVSLDNVSLPLLKSAPPEGQEEKDIQPVTEARPAVSVKTEKSTPSETALKTRADKKPSADKPEKITSSARPIVKTPSEKSLPLAESDTVAYKPEDISSTLEASLKPAPAMPENLTGTQKPKSGYNYSDYLKNLAKTELATTSDIPETSAGIRKPEGSPLKNKVERLTETGKDLKRTTESVSSSLNKAELTSSKGKPEAVADISRDLKKVSELSAPKESAIRTDLSADISKDPKKPSFTGSMRSSDPVFTGTDLDFLKNYTRKKFRNQHFDSYLFISLRRQRMYHIVNDTVARIYAISGSKFGTGNKHGSNRTPVGLHTIVEKYGYNAPKGGLFVERNFTGKVAKIHKEKYCVGSDDVTTRVLWLKGNEPGVNQGGNVDSYKRFIYIHGTPEEGLIGVPSSEGCIRMKNSEVMDLFSFAYVGMKVLILDDL